MLLARRMRLVPTNVSFYADATWEYLDCAEVKLLSGLMPSWPGASHVEDSSSATDRWTIGVGPARREFELVTGNIKRLVSQAESPLQFLGDFEFTVNVTYAAPVPILDWSGQATTATNESVRLRPCPRHSAEDLLRMASFSRRWEANPSAPLSIGPRNRKGPLRAIPRRWLNGWKPGSKV